MGWIVVRVWEHDVKADPEAAARLVLARIKELRKAWKNSFN